MRWYLAVLKKYAVFRGRARRREYWMFVLVHLLVLFAAIVVDVVTGRVNDDGSGGFFVWLYYAATFVPTLAVSVRRLHDTGRSGWWLLLNAVSLVGQIAVLAITAMDGEPADNRYGPSPKGAVA